MFKFELTEQQLHTIATALGELPFKLANPLLIELQNQVNEQQSTTPSPEIKSKVKTASSHKEKS